MNLFKEEFSQLLVRYISINNNYNNTTPEKPLTCQQILDVVREVLKEKLNTSFQSAADDQSFRTPANEIVITTPNAPDVLRMDCSNQGSSLQARYDALKSLKEEEDGFTKIPNVHVLPSTEEELEVSDNGTAINNKDGKNEIASTNASDQKEMAMRQQNNLSQNFKKNDPTSKVEMYNKINEVHKNAMFVTNQLEEMKELLMPEPKAIRRLSAMMNLPKKSSKSSSLNASLNNTSSSMNKSLRSSTSTIHRNKVAAARRSIHLLQADDPSTTPTSSRPSLGMPSTQSKRSSQQLTKPVSKLALRSNNTSAVAADGGNVTHLSKSPVKVMKNKYSHVQSTIPKASCLPAKKNKVA